MSEHEPTVATRELSHHAGMRGAGCERDASVATSEPSRHAGTPAAGSEAVLAACVAIPARDEEKRIEECLAALAAQRGAGRFEIVLVLDRCRDETEARAAAFAQQARLPLTIVEGPADGPGPARRTGMDIAARRLLAAGRPHGLIATTDADTRVAPDWVARQLAHVARGARAIGGWIELDPAEAARLPPHAIRRRGERARERFTRIRQREPHAEHHHFGGASIGVTAEAYLAVGGIEPRPVLEDDGFAERLYASGITVLRALDVRVTTSARIQGRAERGLAADLAALCADEA